MLIQKTFHMHMARELAKANLSDLPGYHRYFSGVDTVEVDAEGVAHIQFRLPCGFYAELYLSPVPGENPNQRLFRSCGGNAEVLGIVDYFEIKPILTEVVLTVDYTIHSLFFRFVDHLTHGVDRFLNGQLERLEAHFDQPVVGIRADTTLRKPINGHHLRENPA